MHTLTHTLRLIWSQNLNYDNCRTIKLFVIIIKTDFKAVPGKNRLANERKRWGFTLLTGHSQHDVESHQVEQF